MCDSRNSSTIDTIRHLCKNKNHKESIRIIDDICSTHDDVNSATTIDAIKQICNNHNSINSKPAATIASIRNVCEGAIKEVTVEPIRQHKRQQQEEYRYLECPSNRSLGYDPGVSYFNAIVTPVTNLMPQFSRANGSVEFRMRRKNKTITFQWEPFSGLVAANGVAFLTVMQSIWNSPPYPISIPIYIIVKNVNKITNITIDPMSTTSNIRFYLNSDGSATDINVGDMFYIYGGCVSWIVD